MSAAICECRGGHDASASIEFYGDESKVAAHNPRAADPARAVALGGHKLIEQSGELGLFDLRMDRGERRDLSLERPELVDRLVAHLPELRFSDEEPVNEEELPPEVIEQLRQLGYGH